MKKREQPENIDTSPTSQKKQKRDLEKMTQLELIALVQKQQAEIQEKNKEIQEKDALLAKQASLLDELQKNKNNKDRNGEDYDSDSRDTDVEINEELNGEALNLKLTNKTPSRLKRGLFLKIEYQTSLQELIENSKTDDWFLNNLAHYLKSENSRKFIIHEFKDYIFKCCFPDEDAVKTGDALTTAEMGQYINITNENKTILTNFVHKVTSGKISKYFTKLVRGHYEILLEEFAYTEYAEIFKLQRKFPNNVIATVLTPTNTQSKTKLFGEEREAFLSAVRKIMSLSEATGDRITQKKIFAATGIPKTTLCELLNSNFKEKITLTSKRATQLYKFFDDYYNTNLQFRTEEITSQLNLLKNIPLRVSESDTTQKSVDHLKLQNTESTATNSAYLRNAMYQPANIDAPISQNNNPSPQPARNV